MALLSRAVNPQSSAGQVLPEILEAINPFINEVLVLTNYSCTANGKFAFAGERALFLETHSNIFAWIDEWYGMSIEKLRELEDQLYSPSDEVSLL
ncbi:Phosphatidylinositol transfer protein 2 [Bienertia sinuspersici]